MSADSLASLADYVIEQQDAYAALALHPFLDQTGRERLDQTLFSAQRYKLLFAAALYTPASVLDRLADEEMSQICLRLARNPNTATETLLRLYQQRDNDHICRQLAAHVNAASVMLADIASDCTPSEAIKLALSSNEHTPLKTLSLLLEEGSSDVCKRLAQNPSCDEGILQQLWLSEDDYLRAEVAAHPNASSALRLQAADSSNAFVRRKLATSPCLEMAIVLRLLRDESDQVRAAIVRNHSITDPQMESLSDDPSNRVRRSQAQREGLPAKVIEHCVRDTDCWVRRWIARNPIVPEQLLAQLAEDKDTHVRRAVSRNPRCTDRILLVLSEDESAWVRAGVALRPDLSQKILQKLVGDTDIDVMSAVGRNPMTDSIVLQKIARHENRDVRRAVILNRAASVSVLTLLLEDPYPLNRIFLAAHPQSGIDIRWQLAKDPDNEVRFSAVRAIASALSKIQAGKD